MMQKKNQPNLQVLWFKRDLRIHDHAPLCEAAQRGAVLGLYLYEPELLSSAEFSAAHLIFINQSLAVVEEEFLKRGATLLTRQGEAVESFEKLWQQTHFSALWSHAETGNDLTYQRDLRVAQWCRSRGVDWQERRQDGVVRKLKSRNGWAQRWQVRMEEPLCSAPTQMAAVKGLTSHGWLQPQDCGLGLSTQEQAQQGGARAGQACLDSFLTQRGVNYRADMSSPVAGWEGCSRISPYLAWGCLSLRAVAQQTVRRQQEIRELRLMGQPVDRRWAGSLTSFAGRLRWHCHFMQKLEDEPRLEFANLSRSCDGLREEFSQSDEGLRRLQAWTQGETGYPMVDACLRCVRETGWLNFRMRAMVVSFASYYLWLHWRPTGLWLGRQFLDFEPGIHWSQFQMQSGTTGINAMRVYSPAKQAQDQDPAGLFIRCWLPELTNVPLAHLVRPDLMSHDEQVQASCIIGRDYPAPMVDPVSAPRESKERMSMLRKQAVSKEEAKRIYFKHGSRKKQGTRVTKSKKQITAPDPQDFLPGLV